MSKGKRILAVAATVAAGIYSASAWSESVTYTGSGTVTGYETLMPLVDGESVVTAISSGLLAVSTTPPSILAVQCSAMGLMDARDNLNLEYYCRMRDTHTGENAIALKGVETPEGNVVEIIGGAGRWAGASGKGIIKQTTGDDNRSDFTMELTITTP